MQKILNIAYIIKVVNVTLKTDRVVLFLRTIVFVKIFDSFG